MGIVNKVGKWSKLYFNQFHLRRWRNNHCKENSNILLIKLDAIGDFIIWLDSAKEYKNMFPDKKCFLLCSEACSSLALATGYFDVIYSLDLPKFETDKKYQLQKISELKKLKFGLLIQTAYSRTQHMDIIAAVIPAKKKIAFAADESKSNLSRSLLNKRNKQFLDGIYDVLISTTKDNLMELRRNSEFLKGLGKNDFVSSTPRLPKVNNKVQIKKAYCVIFPGASTKVKMWDTNKYVSVIEYILSNTEVLVYICGSKNEKYLYDKIVSMVTKKDRVINYCGKVNLVNLIEVVRNAEFVVSNDTSGIHYAAATGVTAVCPFGEYNYGRFLPYDCDIKKDNIIVCSANMKCRNCADRHMTVKCIFHILKTGRYLCIDKVESKDVIAEISKIMQQK